jgi:hypothetical protein
MTVLMEFIHRDIAPRVGRKIISLDLVPGEMEYAPVLAELLRDGTRAMHAAILQALFPGKEE